MLAEPAPGSSRCAADMAQLIASVLVKNYTATPTLEALLKTVPISRIGRADEIADVLWWLCSSASTLVIGQGIAVDGEYTIQ